MTEFSLEKKTDITAKRKKIVVHMTKVLKMLEPKGDNAKRYKERLEAMTDKQFDQFIEDLRSGKEKICVYAPNMKNNLRMNDIFDAAHLLGVKCFERVKIWDPVTQRHYLTPHEYPILKLPIRRVKQTLESKMSIPESDRRIDLYSGQVVKPDKGAAFSLIEAQTVLAKGLKKSIMEVMNTRGGNIEAYASLKSQLEERGVASLAEIDPSTKVRSVTVAGVYLKAMMIDNTL